MKRQLMMWLGLLLVLSVGCNSSSSDLGDLKTCQKQNQELTAKMAKQETEMKAREADMTRREKAVEDIINHAFSEARRAGDAEKTALQKLDRATRDLQAAKIALQKVQAENAELKKKIADQ